jgi:hypothetical protein
MDFLCVDDRMTDENLGVNRANRNRARHDRKMGAMTDVSHGHRKNGMDDRNDLKMVVNLLNRNRALRDPKTDENSDVNRGRHKNVTDDHSMDDDHHGVLVDHHKNVTDDRNDLKMVVNHVSRNYVLPDQNLVVKMDVSLYLRMNGMDDRNDLNLDVSLGLHMSDLLDDHSTDDDHHDALVGHRKNGMDDRNDLMTDVNRVNRNYAPRDRKMGANLDAMNRPVKLMVYLSKSCDRMSHDHLRCGHLKMRHHDTNRMDGKNLDGKMKIHHVIHRMKVYRMRLNRASHLMMVCRMKI